MLQAVALTAVLAVALGGCSDGDSDSNADASLVGAPAVGTWWQVPPVNAGDEEYRFDGSPQVPCTERHTTQTVAVYPREKPTPQIAPEEDRACAEEVQTFMGSSDPVGPWKYLMFLPSRDQVASGASWVRCDVAFAALTAGLRPVWRRGSAEEVLLRRPEEVWACLDTFRDPDYKGLTVQALWQPPNEVFEGNLLGSCWASRPDGQDLPPLR